MRDLNELEGVHLVNAGHYSTSTSHTQSHPLVSMHLEVVQLKFWLGHTTILYHSPEEIEQLK